MGAVYGILGDAGREELEAMGERLSHRGAAGAHWSPARGVHLGMRGASGAVQALTDGPLCGQAGAGFARLNFATPRPILGQMVVRMAEALQNR